MEPEIAGIVEAMSAERGELAIALARAIESTERVLQNEPISDLAGEVFHRRALIDKLLALADLIMKEDEVEA